MIWSLRKEVNSLSLKIVLEKSILGHKNLACAWVLIYHTLTRKRTALRTRTELHKLVEFLNENCGIAQKKKQRETSRKVTSLEQRPQSFWSAQGNPKGLRRIGSKPHCGESTWRETTSFPALLCSGLDATPWLLESVVTDDAAQTVNLFILKDKEMLKD